MQADDGQKETEPIIGLKVGPAVCIQLAKEFQFVLKNAKIVSDQGIPHYNESNCLR